MTLPRANKSNVVLIVEDEALLRMYTADILEDAGFIAIEAENADQAVAMLEARDDIAVLLTDINMPGSMDGVKLAHAVRHRWPPVKIVVVSGHVRRDQIDLPDGSRFFGKPLDSDKIINELQTLIGS